MIGLGGGEGTDNNVALQTKFDLFQNAVAFDIRKQILLDGGQVSFSAFKKLAASHKMDKEECVKFLEENKCYFKKTG